VPGAFPLPMSGVTGSPKSWDYNRDGVAHYGMLPEFIWDSGRSYRRRPSRACRVRRSSTVI